MLVDHHRLLVDNTDSGLLLWDSEGVVISANPSAERLLGLSLDEMRGRASTDARWAIVDDTGEPLRPGDEPVRRVLASGSPVRRSTLGVYRPTDDGDGSYVWLEVGCEPLYRSSDDRPYAVVASYRDVTRRHRTELELRASEARYRLLADNSGDVITRTSRRGTITWVSPSVRRLLGYLPQGLVGAPVAALIHPEDLPKALSTFRSLVENSADGDAVVTMRLRRRGGVYVDVEVAMRAVRSISGTVTEIQSSARDVSARVAAESARRSAEDVFRLALEQAPTGMAVIGLDGRWITVNSALQRITGHSQVAFERLAMSELIHPEDRAGVDETMTAMLEGNVQSAESEIRMITADGGEVWVERSTTLVRDAAGTPSYFVLQVVDISDRIRAQAELTRRAVTDPLTGLPNRLVLQDRLEHALGRRRRERTQVGLVFIDLDHFKTVNDLFGHDVGDEVLRQVAERLSSAIRETDTAVRLGGDEFVVLCEENAELRDLRALADRLFDELSRPYDLVGGEATVTCSLGVTLGSGPDAATLVHQADAAMYRSKQQGRSQISVFEPDGRTSVSHDLSLERELARALDGDELRIDYQPVLRLSDGRVQAREGKVQWQHPTRGLLAPAAFLPVAAQSRLVNGVGAWQLARACRDAAGWTDGAVVAVDAFPRHLVTPGFGESVAAALRSAGLPAERLQIEITESSVLQASTSTLASLTQVTDLGVTLTLDGFGAGLGSVTALQRLPFTNMKLDGALVHRLPDDSKAAALVSGVLRLCADLGIDAVAAGVQTEAQVRWLAEHHCPLVQWCGPGGPEEQGLTPGHGATSGGG